MQLQLNNYTVINKNLLFQLSVAVERTTIACPNMDVSGFGILLVGVVCVLGRWQAIEHD